MWSGPMKKAERKMVSVGGMQDGLMHTDTKVKLVECTPARKKARVGDGCSKTARV